MASSLRLSPRTGWAKTRADGLGEVLVPTVSLIFVFLSICQNNCLKKCFADFFFLLKLIAICSILLLFFFCFLFFTFQFSVKQFNHMVFKTIKNQGMQNNPYGKVPAPLLQNLIKDLFKLCPSSTIVQFTGGKPCLRSSHSGG